MESLCGDTEESSEDVSGRKRSKFKSLKARLFGKSKKAGGEGNTKLSQSESDITAGKGLCSEEDLVCSQGMMGSRALSHDSIFLADQDLTNAEPVRVLSQENVHSKIKALQIKLQQQKMHFGPPPLVLSIRQRADEESSRQDDSLPHSPPEISGVNLATSPTLVKTIYQPFLPPVLPVTKPAPTKCATQTPSHPLSFPMNFNSSAAEPPLDFSTPAHFTPCLDTSAARHRMSIKPRNQRASSKKRLPTVDSQSHSHTQNNIDHPPCVREEELSTQTEVTLEREQEEADNPITTQHLPSEFPEIALGTLEATSNSSSPTQQDQVLSGRLPSVTPLILRVKPQRSTDVTRTERPHSSFIPSEQKNKREGGLETPAMFHDKRNAINSIGIDGISPDQDSVVASRPSSAHQQVHSETESTETIKRPTPASGSFHFSITTAKNRDGVRPRSGSFVGVLEQSEARYKTEAKPFLVMKEKAELKDLQQRGSPARAPHKSSFLPWDRRYSLKKVEADASSKNATTDTGAVEVEGERSSQEVMEETVKVQEVEKDEVKTTFGIKLRTTSQSFRLRSDTSLNQNSKPAVCEAQCDKQDKQIKESSDCATYVCKATSLNISCTPSTSEDIQVTDPASSSSSTLVKDIPPLTCYPHNMSTEQPIQSTSSNTKEAETVPKAPQEPQPAPQTAPSEVSWMSLAMEKTRSLQQLIASRFPRDFTGGQARPQTHVQTTNQTETIAGAQLLTSTSPEAANQPSADAGKAEPMQSKSQAQIVKPKMASSFLSNTTKEEHPSKQIHESHSQPNTTQSASQAVSIQTHPRTTQSSLLTSIQAEISSQSPKGSFAQFYLSSGQQQQQPLWGNQGKPGNKCTAIASKVCVASSATTPAQVSVSRRGETEAIVQEKEDASVSGRRAVWPGSAFLEKQAEWTSPGTKGVEVKTMQTDRQTLGESQAFARTTPLNKDTKSEERQGLNPADMSSTKVPERPFDDKWLRKNVLSSSSNSSSTVTPPAFHSSPDSSQPSWMELAKRKSMAWTDKSVD